MSSDEPNPAEWSDEQLATRLMNPGWGYRDDVRAEAAHRLTLEEKTEALSLNSRVRNTTVVLQGWDEGTTLQAALSDHDAAIGDLLARVRELESD